MDVVNHWDVGYLMFRDRQKFSARFVEGDVMFPNQALKALEGRMNIVSIVSVLHQWGLEDQVQALKEIVKLFRSKDDAESIIPQGNGHGQAVPSSSLVVGFQIGSLSARITERNTYRHDPVSFTKLWERLGQETDTRWECDAKLREFEDVGVDGAESAFLGEDARMLQFVVRRVK